MSYFINNYPSKVRILYISSKRFMIKLAKIQFNLSISKEQVYNNQYK